MELKAMTKEQNKVIAKTKAMSKIMNNGRLTRPSLQRFRRSSVLKSWQPTGSTTGPQAERQGVLVASQRSLGKKKLIPTFLLLFHRTFRRRYCNSKLLRVEIQLASRARQWTLLARYVHAQESDRVIWLLRGTMQFSFAQGGNAGGHEEEAAGHSTATPTPAHVCLITILFVSMNDTRIHARVRDVFFPGHWLPLTAAIAVTDARR
jgi:hypothetical protein